MSAAAAPGAHDGAVLRAEGLGKRFAGGWVLEGVDLALHPGEIVGLVGQGGHGKSVLLKCLAGLLAPDAGRVVAFGEDLATLSSVRLAKVREAYGYVFQNYALFDFMTVADNVAFPLRQRGDADERAVKALVRERLAEVGLAAAVGLYPRELSGGMKKRVGLVRATVTDPDVILYDDPSAGLDPVTSSKIFELIARMQERRAGSAAIVVSHDIDRMRAICARYVMLERGRVVFEGGEEHVAGAPRAVSDFFDLDGAGVLA